MAFTHPAGENFRCRKLQRSTDGFARFLLHNTTHNSLVLRLGEDVAAQAVIDKWQPQLTKNIGAGKSLPQHCRIAHRESRVARPAVNLSARQW